MRRYRIFSFDFDSRALGFQGECRDGWDEAVKEQWRANRAQAVDELVETYGAANIEQKIADFRDFGSKPFSIIAHHNALFEQVRTAFVSGGYYAALTSACTLGERILNHLILDLRDHYTATPEYRRVHGKASFDNWKLAINTLAAWNVLLPAVADEFRAFEGLRHRSIHFNPQTAAQPRADALQAIGHLQAIISGQFAGLGPQPWFMTGIPGYAFIKKAWEDDPFVRHYYLPGNVCVGPWHNLDFRPPAGWQFVDHPDYGAYGLDALTDEQFIEVFNARDPELLAQFPTAPAAAEG